MNLNKNSKIFIAGHTGMVGSSLLEKLKTEKYKNLIFASREKLNLLDQRSVGEFLRKHKPDLVIISAAKVGGIYANKNHPAEFIYENLMIECNLIHQSFLNDIKNIIFLGSSCIYPKFSDQPIKEEYLLNGELESSNRPYALAKISGIELCNSYSKQYGLDYRCLMPTNLYGPRDNFNLQNSHVIPALIRKFHEAKEKNKKSLSIWGRGIVKREFLHVDDLSSAVLFIMRLSKRKFNKHISAENLSHINIGSGKDLKISELANLIKEVTQYKGELCFDSSKLEGTPRKLLDISRISSLGWEPEIDLKSGLKQVYCWYQDNLKDLRK